MKMECKIQHFPCTLRKKCALQAQNFNMLLILNTFHLKYLEKLIDDKYNIFLAVSFAAPLGNEQRLVQQQNAWNTYCIAMFGGFFVLLVCFFSPHVFSRGLLQPFSRAIIMYMKLNHPFGKLDIIIPQSCGINLGHRHGIYI